MKKSHTDYWTFGKLLKSSRLFSFLIWTMGIIVKARVVVKGNEKVCVYSTYHSDSTVNSRHYSRQSRSRAQGAFLKLASLGEDWP